MSDIDPAALAAERARLEAEYIGQPGRPSSARGIHHLALISSNVEETIRFYQGVLEFPLTEVMENRDYPGSTHFFFDVGNGNLLAFFDFPGLGLGPYAEVLGGFHHIAISVTEDKLAYLRGKLDAAGIPHFQQDGYPSMFVSGPDGARVELISYPLGELGSAQTA